MTGAYQPLLEKLEPPITVDERVVELFLTAAGKRLKRRAQDIPPALLCKVDLSLADLAKPRTTLQRLTRQLHEATKVA